MALVRKPITLFGEGRTERKPAKAQCPDAEIVRIRGKSKNKESYFRARSNRFQERTARLRLKSIPGKRVREDANEYISQVMNIRSRTSIISRGSYD